MERAGAANDRPNIRRRHNDDSERAADHVHPPAGGVPVLVEIESIV